MHALVYFNRIRTAMRVYRRVCFVQLHTLNGLRTNGWVSTACLHRYMTIGCARYTRCLCRIYLESFGLTATKNLLDKEPPGSSDNIIVCAAEKASSNKCHAVPECDSDGQYTVRYGIPGRSMDKKFSAAQMPVACSMATFGRDPAGGRRVTSLSARTHTHTHTPLSAYGSSNLASSHLRVCVMLGVCDNNCVSPCQSFPQALKKSATLCAPRAAFLPSARRPAARSHHLSSSRRRFLCATKTRCAARSTSPSLPTNRCFKTLLGSSVTTA